MLLLPALASLAAIALTPHKEARFLYPGLVMLEVAAIPGWLGLLSSAGPWLQRVMLTASLAAGLALVPWLERYGAGVNTLARKTRTSSVSSPKPRETRRG